MTNEVDDFCIFLDNITSPFQHYFVILQTISSTCNETL